MVWAGRKVRSQTDYILGTDQSLFWNVSVQDSRNNSYPYIVLGCLLSAPLREKSTYLGGRKPPPPPTTPTKEDVIFTALRKAVLKPQAQDSGEMRQYRRPCGNLSTGESLLAEIVQSTSPLFGGWAARSQRY